MQANRKLVPYCLVGMLLLGSGLGIGFGVAESGMTFNAAVGNSKFSDGGACIQVASKEIQCKVMGSSLFSDVFSLKDLPSTAVACMNEKGRRVLHLSGAVSALRECLQS
jgi:hypothetical protein